jgi:glutamyl-tRNA synthetase
MNFMNVITRFAPSPTGYLHVGGVRTAIFNYLFAKNYEGKFLLRIEDTDDKRLVESSLISIVEGLKWLGIEHDGEIIVQSENLKRHQEVAKQLIDEGKAYYCYCMQGELDEERRKFGGFGYKYSGKCKHRKDIPTEIKPTIRLNSKFYEKIEFEDLLVGPSSFGRDNLDDFILMRSDGIPTYMFAVVVDDYDACVTHVIRGNDHHTNTAKQLMVYKAMEWDEPQYVHLPLINSEDGMKMSKRKHAVDLLEYRKIGFLPDALLNYLMTLGWTPSKEIISLEEASKEFGVGKLTKSPACFDMRKLLHVNSQYLQVRNHNDLIVEIAENYELNHQNQQLPEYFLEALRSSLTESVKRAQTLHEIINQSYFYFKNWKDFMGEQSKKDMEDFIEDILKKEANLLKDLLEEFLKIDDKNTMWNQENIKNVIDRISEKYKAKLKKSDVMKFLRMKLTGIFDSYSIVLIIEILGRDEVLKRLEM